MRGPLKDTRQSARRHLYPVDRTIVVSWNRYRPHYHSARHTFTVHRSQSQPSPSRQRSSMIAARSVVTNTQNSLCSNPISLSGSKPTQALIMFTRALRCLVKALTTGVPGGVSGALSM
jgi:hypothetical protein